MALHKRMETSYILTVFIVAAYSSNNLSLPSSSSSSLLLQHTWQNNLSSG